MGPNEMLMLSVPASIAVAKVAVVAFAVALVVKGILKPAALVLRRRG